MPETLECGGVVCGYEAEHLYGFDNMPSYFQNIIMYDDYDYDPEVLLTASKFASPTKSIVLEKRAGENYKQNPDAKIRALVGTAFHLMAELSDIKAKDLIKERRFKVKFGKDVTSAKVDVLYRENGEKYLRINDFKTQLCGADSFAKPDHTLQLSIGRLFAKIAEDLEVEPYGYIFHVFDDYKLKWAECWHNQNDQSFHAKCLRHLYPKYPLSPFMTSKIKLMSYDDTEKFVDAKLKEVRKCLDLPESKLEPCPRGEMWRCKDYCRGRDICKQYQGGKK